MFTNKTATNHVIYIHRSMKIQIYYNENKVEKINVLWLKNIGTQTKKKKT